MTMRKAILITFEGKTHTLREWSVIRGINLGTIRARFRQKQSVADVLSLVLHSRFKKPSTGVKIEQAKRGRKAVAWTMDAPRPEHGHRTFYVYKGERRSLAEWSVITGVQVQALRDRIRKGRAPEVVMARPVERPIKLEIKVEHRRTRPTIITRTTPITFMGETMTVEAWVDDLSLSIVRVLSFLNAGKPIEACLAPAPLPFTRARKRQPTAPAALMKVPSLAEVDAGNRLAA